MILVTGATGTAGSELVPGMLAAGLAVRVLTRNPAKAARFGGKVQIAVGDLGKPEALAAVMDRVQGRLPDLPGRPGRGGSGGRQAGRGAPYRAAIDHGSRL